LFVGTEEAKPRPPCIDWNIESKKQPPAPARTREEWYTFQGFDGEVVGGKMLSFGRTDEGKKV